MALKKIWFDIKAPKEFGEKVVSSTFAVDENQLIGRTLSVSLPDIIQDSTQFHLLFKFKVVSFTDAGNTVFIGHDVQKDRVYRKVRRGRAKIEAIGDFTTKDGVVLRVKPIVILARKVNTSIKSEIRAKAIEVCKKEISSQTLSDFVKSIASGDLSKIIKKTCNNIYPTVFVEVAKSRVLSVAESEN